MGEAADNAQRLVFIVLFLIYYRNKTYCDNATKIKK